MTSASLEPLIHLLRKIHHLRDAAALLSWDQETYMPAGGGAARAEQLATLQTLAHDTLVSTEMEDLILQWVNPETGSLRQEAATTLDAPSQALLRETWRDFNRARKLPSTFVNTLERECSLAQQTWVEARPRNDFRAFLPHLRTVLRLKLEEAHYLGFEESPYDALLDGFEPQATMAQLRPLFATLRDGLVSLLERIGESTVKPNEALLTQSFDPEAQLLFGRTVLEQMGYRFDCGRLDLSAHPFTTSFHPTDVRVTTRVFEHDLPSCLFSCLHEGGHGLYDQGLLPEHYGTPLAEPVSLGIHESQSRLWENCVGRSRPFWQYWFPILQRQFPRQLGAVSLDEFYLAINRVKPSLIRVEADELTYNLHIMVRFEIEVDLLEQRLAVEELPAVWNQKMRDYLGVVPDRDSDGVLQDVHWSMGAFGYFPTYTLGNLYAAMFFDQARKALPELERSLARGHMRPLKEWLNQHIHQWGRRFSAEELSTRITGHPVSPASFLKYLEQKYGELYQLPTGFP